MKYTPRPPMQWRPKSAGDVGKRQTYTILSKLQGRRVLPGGRTLKVDIQRDWGGAHAIMREELIVRPTGNLKLWERIGEQPTTRRQRLETMVGKHNVNLVREASFGVNPNMRVANLIEVREGPVLTGGELRVHHPGVVDLSRVLPWMRSLAVETKQPGAWRLS